MTSAPGDAVLISFRVFMVIDTIYQLIVDYREGKIPILPLKIAIWDRFGSQMLSPFSSEAAACDVAFPGLLIGSSSKRHLSHDTEKYLLRILGRKYPRKVAVVQQGQRRRHGCRAGSQQWQLHGFTESVEKKTLRVKFPED
ncbi:hypothetical protein Cadr_000011600 [Camelus dromedarius]|uniref:Uncharacterized protein n=1 Tax=Camelus dromedarius TaxID=9838 RepID=A0A5N4DUX4_CAMDR|nr:hypothetical protein Cadr_000011600 [Camelus dromedarius]